MDLFSADAFQAKHAHLQCTLLSLVEVNQAIISLVVLLFNPFLRNQLEHIF